MPFHLQAAVFLTALAASAPAAAQDSSGHSWYLTGAGNLSLLRDSPGTVANVPAPGNPGATLILTNRVDNGWGASTAAGYDFGRFRLEGEVGYTRNDSDRYDVSSPFVAVVRQDGTNEAVRLMTNAYVDLTDGFVQPYVGGGIGVARIRVVTIAATVRDPIPRRLIDDRDSVLAFQLIAGVAVRASKRVKFVGQYRWFDAGEVRGRDSRGERFSRGIAGHNMDIGVRIGF